MTICSASKQSLVLVALYVFKDFLAPSPRNNSNALTGWSNDPSCKTQAREELCGKAAACIATVATRAASVHVLENCLLPVLPKPCLRLSQAKGSWRNPAMGPCNPKPSLIPPLSQAWQNGGTAVFAVQVQPVPPLVVGPLPCLSFISPPAR